MSFITKMFGANQLKEANKAAVSLADNGERELTAQEMIMAAVIGESDYRARENVKRQRPAEIIRRSRTVARGVEARQAGKPHAEGAQRLSKFAPKVKEWKSSSTWTLD